MRGGRHGDGRGVQGVLILSDLALRATDVVGLLRLAYQTAPDSEALVDGDRRLSYRDYWCCVTNFAAELQLLGCCDQRIALCLKNSADLCVAMFAAHMVGAQVVPLNPRYTLSELTQLLQQAEVSLLLFDSENTHHARLARSCAVAHAMEIGPQAKVLAATGIPLGDEPKVELDRRLAMLQFTGGTTGIPKGVNVTHSALAVNIAQREALVPTRMQQERILCVMPLYHCYAIHMCLHNMVNCCGALILVEPFEPRPVLQAFGSEKITLFGGSPTLFNILLAHKDFSRADFESLHVTYSGSAPLSADLLQRWESATGSIVIEGYGQSECGPVISFNPLGGKRKLASVGLPLPDTRIRILSETGEEVPFGECGEICIQGPQVMAGYRNRPKETDEAIRDGWLHTGDIGECDEEGYLFIHGRKKEMLIVSGFNVYPNEIENVLIRHPAVAEVAVVGMDDARSGQRVVAAIRSDAPVDTPELNQFCRDFLAGYKIPSEFHQVDELPKTSVGKLDKVKLKSLLYGEPNA